jgi:two-component system NtrC family sensor kinase
LLENALKQLEETLRASPDPQGKGPDKAVEDLFTLIREVLQNNQLACGRLTDITRCVRNFVRPDDTDWKKGCSIRQIIENALTLVAHELRGRITVFTDFGETAEFECHPNQLSQVFVNLLVNAAQAIDQTGEIRIKTWQENDRVYASVSDTGRGMSPETQARMFETGFTTKEQGSGLGLPISQKTVQHHGGHLEVQSQLGRGTTFVVDLPVVQTSERKPNGEK